jgi:aspartate/glutamate racemase
LNIEAPLSKIGVKELAEHLLETVKDITSRQLSKIVLITTDICLTIDAFKRHLKKTLGLEYVLAVSYNSHSLQLLIKDLL